MWMCPEMKAIRGLVTFAGDLGADMDIEKGRDACEGI
jgi:hypothetical protein